MKQPTSDNWAGNAEQPKDPTRWVPAMIVGALLFGTGCGSGLIFGWIGGTANRFGDPLSDLSFASTDITVKASFPDSVTTGEAFDFVVVITDTRDELRTIQDIDFSGTFCDNMTVEVVTPTPRSKSTGPGYHGYVFEASLQASQSAEFTYRITPNYDGVFTGDITVYVDEYNSDSTPVSIVVLDKD
tara:strand:+ start:26949 stop:27506 length:558 start_codon:yes stop_codon:yes gene_type:complete